VGAKPGYSGWFVPQITAVHQVQIEICTVL